MSPPPRPRSDAVRNRARVIAAARELLAEHSVDIPIDEIARRAGLGFGTVHRHFPTKQDLLAEVVVGDLRQRLDAARAKLASVEAPHALPELLDALLEDGLSNTAVKAMLAESGFDLARARPDVAAELQEVLDQALAASLAAGIVRADVDVGVLKAVLSGALAAQSHPGVPRGHARRVGAIVLDGLKPDPRA